MASQFGYRSDAVQMPEGKSCLGANPFEVANFSHLNQFACVSNLSKPKFTIHTHTIDKVAYLHPVLAIHGNHHLWKEREVRTTGYFVTYHIYDFSMENKSILSVVIYTCQHFRSNKKHMEHFCERTKGADLIRHCFLCTVFSAFRLTS